MNWTEDNLSLLRQRHAQGKSASLIAIEMHISRNAIIGKARRIGLMHWKSSELLVPHKLSPADRSRSWIARRRNLLERMKKKSQYTGELSKSELKNLLHMAVINTAAMKVE